MPSFRPNVHYVLPAAHVSNKLGHLQAISLKLMKVLYEIIKLLLITDVS